MFLLKEPSKVYFNKVALSKFNINYNYVETKLVY